MGGFAKGLRRILTPPKTIRRMFTPPGGSDWIKKYEVGPKLAALTASMIPGVGPYIGAGIGTMTLGTTEAGKALAEGRPWGQAALSGGAQGFGIGFGGGSAANWLSNIGKTQIAGGGFLEGGQIFDAGGSVVGSYPIGQETAMATKLASGIPVAGGGFVGTPGVGHLANLGGVTGAALATGAGGTAGKVAAKGGLSRLVGPALATGAGIASLTAEPPTFDYQGAGERFEAARDSMIQKYLGEAGAALPRATREQYLDLATQPMGELGAVWENWVQPEWNRMEQLVNKSWDDYDEQVDAQFAQAGGIGSSDHLKAKQESRRLRTQELSQSRQEIRGRAFREQLNVKLDALQRGAAQGDFDMKLALELAKMGQRDQELLMAIESEDYDTFQNIMGEIFSYGMMQTFSPEQMSNVPTLQ